MSNIILDMTVSDYSDAAVCSEQNFIHQAQFSQIKSILHKQLSKKCEFDENHITRAHNTISIFGSRGTGKTTFLLTVLDYIEKKYEKATRIQPLDPSLIDCKQHPFINVIAAIHEKIEQYDKQTNFKPSNYRHNLEMYNEAYRNVLKGLPFMDGVGNENIYKDWDDDLFISMQGMEKAEASNNLEKYFHIYVNKALQLMEKEFLVIPFDDIDTNFNKGYEILELIRKYLTSEQIITILTGDLELYGKLVRKASWKCFDTDFLNKEYKYAGKDKTEFSNMINQLENQYLLKILKPENRIQLLTLQENKNEFNTLIEIEYSEDKIESLEISYKELLKTLLSTGKFKEYINFLEGLSLRTQLRIIKLIQRTYTDTEFATHRERIVQAFVNIFCNDINQKAINAKSLLGYSKYYAVEIQKFLYNANILHQCSDLVPQTKDDTLNKALLAISTLFKIQVEKKEFMIFDYWIRICYLDYMSQAFDYKTNDDLLKDFIKFTSIGDYNNLSNCVGKGEAFYQGLQSLKQQKQQESTFKFINTIPGTIALKTIPSLNNKFDLASLILHGSLNNDKQEKCFASIYKLFAVIRDFLFNCKGINETFSFLLKETEFKTYLEPNNLNDFYDIQNTKAKRTFDKSFGKITDIINELPNWAKIKNYQNDKISAKSLNRIFTRMYFSIIDINKNNEFDNLGDKFNSYLIAFLNAAIEEDLAVILKDKVLLNVENRLEHRFRNNLEKIQVQTRTTLSTWLIECPLIRLFLNPCLKLAIDSTLNNESNDTQEKLWNQYEQDERLRKIRFLKEKQAACDKLIKRLEDGRKWMDTFQFQKDTDNTELEKCIISFEPFEKTKIVLHPLLDRSLLVRNGEQLSISLANYYLISDEIKNEIESSIETLEYSPNNETIKEWNNIDNENSGNQLFIYLTTVKVL